MKTNIFDYIKAQVILAETSNAYSFDRYREEEWVKCIIFLMQEGLEHHEIVLMLRAKIMRWAGDQAKGIRPKAEDFIRYYNAHHNHSTITKYNRQDLQVSRNI